MVDLILWVAVGAGWLAFVAHVWRVLAKGGRA